jgi:hypothetical protein
VAIVTACFNREVVDGKSLRRAAIRSIMVSVIAKAQTASGWKEALVVLIAVIHAGCMPASWGAGALLYPSRRAIRVSRPPGAEDVVFQGEGVDGFPPQAVASEQVPARLDRWNRLLRWACFGNNGWPFGLFSSHQSSRMMLGGRVAAQFEPQPQTVNLGARVSKKYRFASSSDTQRMRPSPPHPA